MMSAMAPPPPESAGQATPTGSPVPRIIGAVVSLVAGLPFALLLVAVLRSRFGGPATDPHGYTLIFGTFGALVTGLVASVSIPWVFPAARRPRVQRWCLLGYVVVAASLIALLLTA